MNSDALLAPLSPISKRPTRCSSAQEVNWGPYILLLIIRISAQLSSSCPSAPEATTRDLCNQIPETTAEISTPSIFPILSRCCLHLLWLRLSSSRFPAHFSVDCSTISSFTAPTQDQPSSRGLTHTPQAFIGQFLAFIRPPRSSIQAATTRASNPLSLYLSLWGDFETRRWIVRWCSCLLRLSAIGDCSIWPLLSDFPPFSSTEPSSPCVIGLLPVSLYIAIPQLFATDLND